MHKQRGATKKTPPATVKRKAKPAKSAPRRAAQVIKHKPKPRGRTVKRTVKKPTTPEVPAAPAPAPAPLPMPPSLAQIQPLLLSIYKDVELLRTTRPRSRDARLMASGISRACDEIAKRCRDFAGVEDEEVKETAATAPAAPAAITAPPAAVALPTGAGVVAPAARPVLPARPPVIAQRPVTAAPPAIAPPKPSTTTPPPRDEVKDPAPTGAPADAPQDDADDDQVNDAGGAPHGANHVLLLAAPNEDLASVAARLAKGVTCSFVGRAAAVRHVDHKGYLTESSQIIVVRANGEVLGSLPWSTTVPGTGEDTKTYYMFANPELATPASGTIDMRGVQLKVPIAIGPGVRNKTLEQTDAAGAKDFADLRAALGRDATSVCGIS